MPAGQDFSLVLATADEYGKIEDFIHDHFNDMPLFTAFNIAHNNRPPSSVYGPEDFILKAQKADGTIMGIAVNRTKVIYPNTNFTETSWLQLRKFMEFVADDSRVSSLPEKTIELRILSMNPEYRGRGIAKSLVEESMRLAKSRGFEVMKMCCTSEFTAKIARSLGWQEFYRLAYKDYGKLSGSEFVMKPTPPHDHLYYYITPL